MTSKQENASHHATSLRMWLNWVFLSTCLNFGWEVLHYPLYNVSTTHVGGIRILAILHCTLGDALISAIAFLGTSVLLRASRWPVTCPWRGLLVFVMVSVAYTVFSEQKNTEVIGSWNYASEMPLLWGIGVSPLMQWIVVPAFTLWVISMRAESKKRFH